MGVIHKLNQKFVYKKQSNNFYVDNSKEYVDEVQQKFN